MATRGEKYEEDREQAGEKGADKEVLRPNLEEDLQNHRKNEDWKLENVGERYKPMKIITQATHVTNSFWLLAYSMFRKF